jgi:ubiquinone/menaquinone biosynthesis C-methylase UbiE
MIDKEIDKINYNISYSDSWWATASKLGRFFSYSEKMHAYTAFKISKFETPHPTILDIGFGAGYLLDQLQFKMNSTSFFAGLDISWQNVRSYTARLKKRLKNNAAALPLSPFKTQLPLSDNSVDMVYCNHVIEHVPSDKDLIEEIWRILKPNGFLIIMAPINEDNLDVPTHVRKYSTQSFNNLLSKCFNLQENGINDSFSNWIRYLGVNKFPFHSVIKRSLIFALCLCPFSMIALLDNMLLSQGCKPAQVFARAIKKEFIIQDFQT